MTFSVLALVGLMFTSILLAEAASIINIDNLIPKYCKTGETNPHNIKGAIQWFDGCSEAYIIDPKQPEQMLKIENTAWKTSDFAPSCIEGKPSDAEKEYYLAGIVEAKDVGTYLSKKLGPVVVKLTSDPSSKRPFLNAIRLKNYKNPRNVIPEICDFPLNKYVQIQGKVEAGPLFCTAMECPSVLDKNGKVIGKTCCNSCGGSPVINGKYLKLKINETGCSQAPDCKISCGTYELGKEYLLKGSIQKLDPNDDAVYGFKVSEAVNLESK